ncbi:uncharacterized protein LOC143302918 [Bombus vancouverensis nearcticus]|uniref:uncharacterized protein LOC143302918 n=1 Tax=Bombus vancouverensis nearcticus TaxID=2705178 RepID=UPI00402B7979
MHGLNEFNFKKMWPEGERVNMPPVRSSLPLADTRAICFMIKRRTRRFDYSMRLNDFEEVQGNHPGDKRMDRIHQDIANISSSMYHLFYTRMTEEDTPENPEKTPGNQNETPGNQNGTPENQKDIPGNQENTPAKKDESDFVFLKPKTYQCYYCRKVFFHPTIYRRHMIHQLKNLHWCSVCKRGFVSRLWFKKHKLFCYIL